MFQDAIQKNLFFPRQGFLRDAKVIDIERGHISASAFNLRMKPAILAASARFISHAFKGGSQTLPKPALTFSPRSTSPTSASTITYSSH